MIQQFVLQTSAQPQRDPLCAIKCHIQITNGVYMIKFHCSDLPCATNLSKKQIEFKIVSEINCSEMSAAAMKRSHIGDQLNSRSESVAQCGVRCEQRRRHLRMLLIWMDGWIDEMVCPQTKPLGHQAGPRGIPVKCPYNFLTQSYHCNGGMLPMCPSIFLRRV